MFELMKNMEHNDAFRQIRSSAKTFHIPGQNPGLDMQILPNVLVALQKCTERAHVLKVD